MAEFGFVEAKEKMEDAVEDLTHVYYLAGMHDGMTTLFSRFIEFRNSKDNEHCEVCRGIANNMQTFIDIMKEMFPDLKDVKNA